MRLSSPAHRRRPALAGAVALLSAAALALTGVALPAQAADNPNIQFSNVGLAKVDGSGSPYTDDSQLKLETDHDQAKLSVSWALPNGSPLVAGDSFTITLPPEFNSSQTSAGGLGRPEFKVDTTGDGVAETTVGSCLIELSKITCTFNEKAAELVGQGGFQNFSGNVGVRVTAKGATDLEALPFTFSGQPNTISVDLPGTGGIAAGRPKNPYKFTPAHYAKGSSAIGSSSRDISFVMGISTSVATSKSFAFLARQAGQPITFDGTEKTLTFTDTLGSGLKFDDPANWKFSFTDSAATDTDAADVPLASGNGVATDSEKGTWTFRVEPGEVTPDGQVAKLHITGPFEADANYLLAYKALPLEGDRLKPGFKYENVLTYDDADLKAVYSRSFSAAFTSDATMNPGYGTFAVTKFVGGPGSALVPQGSGFTVKATYTLPNQQTTDSFPGWTAPGTVNAAKTGGEVMLTAKVGEKVTFYGPTAGTTFPAGTRITLAEVENPAAAPAGYGWESHTFTVKDQPITEVTVGSRLVSPVDLTNRLQKQPTGRFSLTKTVEGLTGGAVAPAEYTFHYVCNDAAATEGDLQVPSDGTVITSPEIADGAQCTITENVAGAEVAGHRLTPAAEQSVTIQAGQTVEATATNVYAPTTGRFTLTKKVVNNDGAVVPAEFAFTVTCGDEAPEEVTLAADATWTSKELADGTSCTVAENTAAAQVKGYVLAADIATSPVMIEAGQTGAVVATNTYTREPMGTFQVVKSASGAPGVETKDFTFTYTCPVDGNDVTGTVVAKGDGVAVQAERSFPVGTKCTVTEDTAAAAVDGYSLAASDPQTVTIGEDPVQAEFTNTYTLKVGAFQVVKTASGAPGVETKDYTFAYVCGAEQGTVTAKGDGVAVEVGATFPVGTECTVTEDTAAAAVDGYSLAASDPQTVTIGEDPVQAEFTNTYTLKVGAFQVVKTASGAPGVETKDYTFAYVCGAEQGTVTAKGDGVAVEAGKSFPVGTECTVSEDVDAAQVDGHTLTAPAAQTLTVGEEPVKAEFVNTYTQQLVSIGDRVWLDANRDGQQDAGEAPVADVKVTLLDAEGNTVATTTTNAEGHYWFADLVPGKQYSLRFDKPEGFDWTTQDQGDDTSDSDVDAQGVVRFTAPAQGQNRTGAQVADNPTLDAGLVKAEAPVPPVDPSPAPSVDPTMAPTATPTVAPSVAPTSTPTMVPTMVPSGSSKPGDPVKPGKPVKPTKPPVKPGLPKTGH
ncbi:MAG: DUF5979 domain-containing protein [Propionibacteriaceae bacterium]|nr:DUF5979 domain-containing protein [Propionibacteriaceae bacterium]